MEGQGTTSTTLLGPAGDDIPAISTKVNVAVRLRPLIPSEIEKSIDKHWSCTSKLIQQIDPKTGNHLKSTDAHPFDHVLGSDKSTEDVYAAVVKPIVQQAFEGFNGTILCYGQTSSGKTYTLYGNGQEAGIIKLTARDLFEHINKDAKRQYIIRVGLLEVYNEEVTDLLCSEKPIKIVEQNGEVVPYELEEMQVLTTEDMLAACERVQRERKIGETRMNKESSRSHTILRISVESLPINAESDAGNIPTMSKSLLNFVDLAGSEKVHQTGATGTRLVEAGHINKSLFHLSQVVMQLSGEAASEESRKNALNVSGVTQSTAKLKPKFVNYRDSKLTRLLQSSLQGNAYIAMVCNVTPAYVDETLSTLRFAKAAKKIQTKPVQNNLITDRTECEKIISDLRLQLHGKGVEVDTLQKRLDTLMKLYEPVPLARVNIQPNARRQTVCPSQFDLHRLVREREESNKLFSGLNLETKPYSSPTVERSKTVTTTVSVEKQSKDSFSPAFSEKYLHQYQALEHFRDASENRKSQLEARTPTMAIKRLQKAGMTLGPNTLDQALSPMPAPTDEPPSKRSRFMGPVNDETPKQTLAIARSMLAQANEDDKREWTEQKMFLDDELSLKNAQLDEADANCAALCVQMENLKKELEKAKETVSSKEYEVEVLFKQTQDQTKKIDKLKMDLQNQPLPTISEMEASGEQSHLGDQSSIGDQTASALQIELEEVRDSLKNLQSTLEAEQAENDELRKGNALLQEHLAENEDLRERSALLEQQQADNEVLSKRNDFLEEKMKALELQNIQISEEMRKFKENADNELLECNKACIIANERIQSLEYEKEQIEKAIASLKDDFDKNLNDTLKIYMDKLEEAQRILKSREDDIQRITIDSDVLSNKIGNMSGEVELMKNVCDVAVQEKDLILKENDHLKKENGDVNVQNQSLLDQLAVAAERKNMVDSRQTQTGDSIDISVENEELHKRNALLEEEMKALEKEMVLLGENLAKAVKAKEEEFNSQLDIKKESIAALKLQNIQISEEMMKFKENADSELLECKEASTIARERIQSLEREKEQIEKAIASRLFEEHQTEIEELLNRNALLEEKTKALEKESVLRGENLKQILQAKEMEFNSKLDIKKESITMLELRNTQFSEEMRKFKENAELRNRELDSELLECKHTCGIAYERTQSLEREKEQIENTIASLKDDFDKKLNDTLKIYMDQLEEAHGILKSRDDDIQRITLDCDVLSNKLGNVSGQVELMKNVRDAAVQEKEEILKENGELDRRNQSLLDQLAEATERGYSIDISVENEDLHKRNAFLEEKMKALENECVLRCEKLVKTLKAKEMEFNSQLDIKKESMTALELQNIQINEEMRKFKENADSKLLECKEACTIAKGRIQSLECEKEQIEKAIASRLFEEHQTKNEELRKRNALLEEEMKALEKEMVLLGENLAKAVKAKEAEFNFELDIKKESIAALELQNIKINEEMMKFKENADSELLECKESCSIAEGRIQSLEREKEQMEKAIASLKDDFDKKLDDTQKSYLDQLEEAQRILKSREEDIQRITLDSDILSDKLKTMSAQVVIMKNGVDVAVQEKEKILKENGDLNERNQSLLDQLAETTERKKIVDSRQTQTGDSIDISVENEVLHKRNVLLESEQTEFEAIRKRNVLLEEKIRSLEKECELRIENLEQILKTKEAEFNSQLDINKESITALKLQNIQVSEEIKFKENAELRNRELDSELLECKNACGIANERIQSLEREKEQIEKAIASLKDDFDKKLDDTLKSYKDQLEEAHGILKSRDDDIQRITLDCDVLSTKLENMSGEVELMKNVRDVAVQEKEKIIKEIDNLSIENGELTDRIQSLLDQLAEATERTKMVDSRQTQTGDSIDISVENEELHRRNALLEEKMQALEKEMVLLGENLAKAVKAKEAEFNSLLDIKKESIAALKLENIRIAEEMKKFRDNAELRNRELGSELLECKKGIRIANERVQSLEREKEQIEKAIGSGKEDFDKKLDDTRKIYMDQLEEAQRILKSKEGAIQRITLDSDVLSDKLENMSGQVDMMKTVRDVAVQEKEKILKENEDLNQRNQCLQDQLAEATKRKKMAVCRQTQTGDSIDITVHLREFKIRCAMLSKESKKHADEKINVEKTLNKEIAIIQKNLENSNNECEQLRNSLCFMKEEQEALKNARSMTNTSTQCNYLAELVKRANNGEEGLMPEGFPDIVAVRKENSNLRAEMYYLEQGKRKCTCKNWEQASKKRQGQGTSTQISHTDSGSISAEVPIDSSGHFDYKSFLANMKTRSKTQPSPFPQTSKYNLRSTPKVAPLSRAALPSTARPLVADPIATAAASGTAIPQASAADSTPNAPTMRRTRSRANIERNDAPTTRRTGTWPRQRSAAPAQPETDDDDRAWEKQLEEMLYDST